jgi:hypothetical protein
MGGHGGGIEQPFRRNVGRQHGSGGQHADGQQCDATRTDAPCHKCPPIAIGRRFVATAAWQQIYITWKAMSAGTAG